MANDKAAAPAKSEAPAQAESPKKNPMLKMAFVAAAIVGLEIGTVGVTMSLSGGPKRVTAQEITPAAAPAPEREVEVKLIDAQLPNSLNGGRLYLYNLQVVTTTDEKNKGKITELFAEKEASIRDRIRTIVASADPKTLSEPGLETLRRQIAYQLEETVGKDLIKEVLIPRCTPMRADY